MMGVDKEATDIWKFGRARPDLSFDESLAADIPELSEAEKAERNALIDANISRRVATCDPQPMIDEARKLANAGPI